MSTALAIAGVSAVLRSVLNDALVAAGLSSIVGGQVTVSSLPPDRVLPASGPDPNQLNIFLYQTSQNSGWRNGAYPSRDSGGNRTSNPPLALNLHYLLTAYGSKDFYSEVILGHAMHQMHEMSLLTRDIIRSALAPAVPVPGLPAELATANLADQFEQLRITPEVLSTEEMFRVWSAIQTHYRPTAAYQVTVVLIEGRRPAKTALPVGGPEVNARGLDAIIINRVVAENSQPFTSTSVLLIQGGSLGALNAVVRVGGFDFTPTLADMSANQIRLPLPTPLPTGMFAGVVGVQVIHPVDLGMPPQPHKGFQSNVEPIVLRPTITPTPQGVTDQVVSGTTFRKGTLQATFVPPVGRSQRVTLYLNEFNPPSNRAANAYAFDVPAGNGITNPAVTETATVDIPFRFVLPGNYLVRIQVDGAESLLGMAAGQYATPQVTI
jgi:hypothetical protein